MSFSFRRPFLAHLDDPPDARRHGRLRCGERLRAWFGSTPFGRVVDLSGSGLRVERRAFRSVDVGSELDLTLRCDESSVHLMMRVIWTKKTGFRRHLIGLEFLNLTPELSETIVRLTHLGRFKFVIAERETDL